MLRCLKVVSVISLAALAGCSYVYGDRGVIQNRDKEYLKAESVPPLRIPPGLSSSTIAAHYPVPDRYYPASSKVVPLTPPDLVVAPEPKITPAPLTTASPEGTATLKDQTPPPNYYYDPYTRTAGAGHSVGSIFDGWFKKKPAQPQASAGQNPRATSTTGAANTAATANNNSSNNTNNNSNNNTNNTQPNANPEAQNAENNTDTIKKENYYFDRYSHR